MTQLSRKDLVLLALLTLFWGLNWPVMKIGVREFPPLTFRTISMVGGLAVIWLAARAQGASLAIPAGARMTVIRLAIPNMLIWHSLIIIGVKLLSSGRAAILGYTMPAWAVLSGLIFFGDRISRSALVGIALAMSGALLLLSSEFSRLSGQPVGTVLALIAAAGWGFGTVLMKRTQLDMPTISLTFWMLSLTTTIMAILALIFEYPAMRMPNLVEWGAIVYNSAIIFGFAHVVWFRLARILPPVASSLSVMFIPVLGTFSGAWILGEVPHWQDYVAMLLILGAMSTVLFKPRPVQQD
ncbi:MAG: DMT family transporter [Oxalobacteraceae bacterium]|jgi:drug/metabolite transporter (DMT)-like permease|nr:DMT family transporter [Oxalobacteraceae bacterium]